MTLRGLALLLAVLVPIGARADRRENYLTLGFTPVLSNANDPVGGRVSAQVVGAGFDLAYYRGITQSFHLGAAVHVGRTNDMGFPAVAATLSDGSRTVGSLYANDTTYGAGLLGLFRLDTGYPFAPVLSLELGFRQHSFSNVQLLPGGATYFVNLPDFSEFVPLAEAGLGVEFRVWGSFLVAAGVTFGWEPGGHAPWHIGLPMRLGYVW